MTEAELWAGQMGREWALHAEALDRQLSPVSEVALAALAPRPGEHVLDLGCGSGATTAALCAAVGPSGQVTGIDISPDQVTAAKARPGNERARLLVADAQTHPFDHGVFDALFSRFGCMFFADPPAAYANLRRALKPGARAVLTAWCPISRNPWAALPAAAAAEVLGPADPPAPGVPGPFAWATPEIFRPILEGAGFTELEYREAAVMLQVGESQPGDPIARALAMMMRIGPAARRLKGLPDEVRQSVAARLAPKLTSYVAEGWVRLPGLIWVITARA
jgi:SAM-dependent methyltransferase